jgi:uncharacterized protein (TIGR03437 family)
VSINGLPCPIYYVSSTQLSVIVPYEVASNQTGLANIQVTNGAASNVVQMYLTDASPGAFSLGEPTLLDQSGEPSIDGIGYGAALHAATYQPVTPSNPAQPGEYISLFMTGLGTVTPTITDGAVGPYSPAPLSSADVYSAGNLGVSFNDYDIGSTGNFGNIIFAGLAPGLAGLYQLNVQVPEGVLGSGDDVYLEFFTDAAEIDQIQIPYGSSFGDSLATTRAKASLSRASRIAAMRSRGSKPSARRVRRGAAATP